ncbi:MAG: ATP-dependent zinc metalloprotease FtsH [Dehalococcoidia bacterium]|nr:ATP-dependent zinc metalloprotease FtsH [Chloroflexota bacterium]
MSRKSIILLIVIALVAAILVTELSPEGERPRELAINELISMAKEGEIQDILVRGTALEITTIDGEKLTSTIGVNTDILEVFSREGVAITGPGAVPIRFADEPRFAAWPVILNFLPLILFGGLLFFLLRRAGGGANQAMGFARSKARMFSGDKPTITFSDVAGVEEAKEELREVVEFLSHSEKFLAIGARIPRGVLLVGPPGTGKTLLSRAVAGEAGVPFFSISGSEFVEMFVGVGAARVRDLFDQAKRHAPCIVFVDEIDAVGRHRGAGLGGGHDEREQTLNQILSEMDGFDTNTNVIVLAATNRPDILDPALLRPGRFDRRVVLDQPDINGRKAILEVHSKGKPLDSTVDLGVIARQTPGFSGADLSNLINEAAILAARREKKEIGLLELEESIDRVIAGPERKSRLMSRREKEITAYHEAGHALVARMLPNADPVHKISIIARGMIAGYTRQLPTEDRYLVTRSQFNDMLATLLGGHSAEEIIFGEMTTGSQNDIERATKIARMMVTEYGMSDKLGPRTFGKREELVFLGREISEQRDYSDKVAEDIDAEVHNIIERAHTVARDILTENKAKLIQIAERLIAEETLEGKSLDALFDPPEPQGSGASVKQTKVKQTKGKKRPARLAEGVAAISAEG